MVFTIIIIFRFTLVKGVIFIVQSITTCGMVHINEHLLLIKKSSP